MNCLKAFGAPDVCLVWFVFFELMLICFVLFYYCVSIVVAGFYCARRGGFVFVFCLFVFCCLVCVVFVCIIYSNIGTFRIFFRYVALKVAICQCPQCLSHIDYICYATNWHHFISVRWVFDSPRSASGHPFRNGCTESYLYAPGYIHSLCSQSRQLV